MSGTSDDDAVHVSVVWLVGEVFEALFDIDSPDPKNDDSILRFTVGFGIIIIKPFNSLVVDIFESLHVFSSTTDGKDVFKPGCASILDGLLEAKG